MKSLINTALLKEQLKRNWAIAGLALLFYILFIILPLYQMFSTPYQKATFIVGLLSMQNPIMIITCLIIPLVIVLISFSYLFQTKATTAIHALPINKNQLLCTNVLAGFILIIIPLVILSIFILINKLPYLEPEVINIGGDIHYGESITLPVELFPQGLAQGEIINTFPVVLGFFLRTMMSFIFYYAVFLFAATISGNGIICILVSIFLPMLPIGLFLISQVIGFYYCFGFEMYNFTNLYQAVFVLSNPVGLGTLYSLNPSGNPLINSVQATNLSPYIITHIVIIILLLAVSAWCYRIRKQERAGDSIVFEPVNNVLIFLVSLAGMLFLGIFFFILFENTWAMYFGLILGFVITYFIAQMIAEKTFNILGKVKLLPKFAGVGLGLFLIVILLTKTDIIGYSSYSPKVEDVEGIFLYEPYRFYKKDSVGGYFVTNPDIIAETIKIQKEIVDNRDSFREIFINSLSRKSYYYIENQQCYFTFKLKDGSLVTRNYLLPYTFRKSSGLTDLLYLNEVILSKYPLLSNKVETDYICSLSINYYDPKKRYPSEQISITDKDLINSLLEETKKDILATAQYEKSLFDDIANKRVESSVYSELPTISVQFEIRDSLKNTRYINTLESCQLLLFENTTEWLQENGYSFHERTDW